MQEELLQASSAVESCKEAQASAKARRLRLLAANHTLNSRILQAGEDLLTVLRAKELGISLPSSDQTLCDTAGRPSLLQTQPTKAGSPGTAHSVADRGSAARACGTPAAPRGAASRAAVNAGDGRGAVMTLGTGSVVSKPSTTMTAPLFAADILPARRPPPISSPGASAGDAPAAAPPLPYTYMATGVLGMHAGGAAVEELAMAREMTAMVQAARTRVASAAGVRPEGVRWFLQGPHLAAGGERLSFSSAISSRRCMASMYANHFTSLLEKAMLGAVAVVSPGCTGGTCAALSPTPLVATTPSHVPPVGGHSRIWRAPQQNGRHSRSTAQMIDAECSACM